MRVAAASLIAVCIAVAGCGSTSSSKPQGCVRSQAEIAYGCGPSDNSAVTYQPDVVIVRGGPAAIRSASSNGLIWTIDRNAPGASDLSVGKVMFVTSSAVGRVVALQDSGDTRIVTLAPVDLVDVIKDADIKVHQSLDPSQMVYQDVPDVPGGAQQPATAALGTAPASGAATVAATWTRGRGDAPDVVSLPPVQLTNTPYIPPLPPPAPLPKPEAFGEWEFKPNVTSTKLGLKVEYKVTGSAGLKAGFDFAFEMNHPQVTVEETIRNGQNVRSGFLLEGIEGFEVSLDAGVKNGVEDNKKVQIDVPLEVSVPIEVFGLPLNIKVSYKFSVATALSGKNSTLLATGKYKLDGPIGVSEGSFTLPTFSVEQSIIDSISGIAIGPSGIVISVKIKLLVGLGVPKASAGPYESLTVSLGLTNGSALGASLARCRGARLVVSVAGGFGLSLDPPYRAALKALLPPSIKLDENSIEVSKEIVNRAQTVPDVPLCTA